MPEDRPGLVAIDRLRIRGPAGRDGSDSRVALRLRVEHLLAGADIYPPTMPPSAVLVVRQLPDPLPGRLARTHDDLWPDPEWVAAARAMLADCWRRSVSLRGGYATAAAERAEAVRFADRAEHLACLAVDLARGTAAAHWWWRDDLSGQPPGVGTVLLREPKLMPAVLSTIVAWNRAPEVLTAVSADEAAELMRAMVAEHAPTLDPQALIALATDRMARLTSPTSSTPPGTAVDSWFTGPDAPSAAASAPDQPPADLLRQAVVRLALLLQHQPSLARSPDFARRARALSGVPDEQPPVTLSRLVQPALVEPTAERGLSGTGDDAAKPTGEREEAAPDRAAAERLGLQPRSPGEPVGASAPIAADGQPWIETEIGGVLYLINLMTRLGLPDSQPGLAEELGAWATLETLARALLDGCGLAPAADPLWRVLAALDGRAAETLPGTGRRVTVPQALPLDWPLVSRDGPAWAPGALTRQLEPSVLSWASLVAPYVRHLLVHWLRPAGSAPTDDDPIAALLQLPARLYAAAAHVDLVAGIERIHLPARMAGLDRDPGWAPALGRTVSFHFR